MKFKLNSSGVDSYTSALKNRLNYVKDQFADEMKEELETISPKSTGKLASSYNLTTLPESIQITNDCGYCKYVNDGTRFQSGQHFIEQAYIDTKVHLEQIIQKSQKISH